MSDMDAKYFSTSDHNKFMSEILNKKIKEKGLVDKSNYCGILDNSDLHKKIVSRIK